MPTKPWVCTARTAPLAAALPFGRSLTYRFAQNSFWAACIWAGLEPLPLPVMKGLIVRNFNWWLGQKMFDRDGILTIGYCYPQMYMAERLSLIHISTRT